jgi:hypothetical protein
MALRINPKLFQLVASPLLHGLWTFQTLLIGSHFAFVYLYYK